jgi:hypothetical protein
MKRRQTIMAAFLTVSLAALSGLACGGGDEPSVCPQITGYVASTTTPLSFATDIYPILADTNKTNGCGQTAICHGQPTAGLDDVFAPTKFLPFIFGDVTAPVNDPAMAKAQLMMPAYHAPGMQRVVASNVGQSFLAYKIWDKERKGLACVASMCSGASASMTLPCGDQMPSVGSIDPANRTKILDWIAQGARD